MLQCLLSEASEVAIGVAMKATENRLCMGHVAYRLGGDTAQECAAKMKG